MTNLKKTIIGLAIASAAGFTAPAALAQAYGDVARVVSSTPVYQRVSSPRSDCRTEQVTAYEERRTVRNDYRPASETTGAGAVLGAIVGGVIGHQFGASSAGRDHGTAAGAVVGGLIGNSIEHDADAAPSREVVVDRVPVTRDVQRCRTVSGTSERIVAYDVRYEYNGHEFEARLPYDPGQEIPVNVDVRPPVARVPAAGPGLPNYRGTY
jgi:uncharacterized protein YcfJ